MTGKRTADSVASTRICRSWTGADRNLVGFGSSSGGGAECCKIESPLPMHLTQPPRPPEVSQPVSHSAPGAEWDMNRCSLTYVHR